MLEFKTGVKRVSRGVETKELRSKYINAVQSRAQQIVCGGLNLQQGIEEEHYANGIMCFPKAIKCIQAISFYLCMQQPNSADIESKDGELSRLLKKFTDSAHFEITENSKVFVQNDVKYNVKNNKGILLGILTYYVYVMRARSLGFCIKEAQLQDLYRSLIICNDEIDIYTYAGKVVVVNKKAGEAYTYTGEGKKRRKKVEDVTIKGSKIYADDDCIFDGVNVRGVTKCSHTLKNEGKSYKVVFLSSDTTDEYGKALNIRLHHLVLLSSIGPAALLLCSGAGGLMTVDHINMQENYNSIDNLRILSRADNRELGCEIADYEKAKKEGKKSIRYGEYLDFTTFFGMPDRYAGETREEILYEIAMQKLLYSMR